MNGIVVKCVCLQWLKDKMSIVALRAELPKMKVIRKIYEKIKEKTLYICDTVAIGVCSTSIMILMFFLICFIAFLTLIGYVECAHSL